MKKLVFLLLCVTGISNAQIVHIPDAVFKTKLLESSHSNTIAKNLDGLYFAIDANNDDEIQVSEALQVSAVNVFDEFAMLFIYDLTGIESFLNLLELNVEGHELTNLNTTQLVNLTELNCAGNQLSSLDVSQNVNLIKLICEGNLLTSLDVSQQVNLNLLGCGSNQIASLDVTQNPSLLLLGTSGNQLTSLDVTHNIVLQSLSCSYNELNNLDVSQNPLLESLSFHYNQLTSLDVSANTALDYLYCHNNQLTSLDLTGNTALFRLRCYDNQLTTLNVNANTALDYLECHANPLVDLFIKNGRNESVLSIGLMPSLVYICADETQIESVQEIVNDFVVVDSDCFLSIDEVDMNNVISIYPNPVHEVLNIKANGLMGSLFIYDVHGRKVLSKPLNQSEITINVSNLTKGIYFLNIDSESGVYSKKLIKN